MPMDPATIELASSVVSVLIPYFAKGAEEFARCAGEFACEKAKGLFNYLESKLSKDNEASDCLEHFKDKPARYSAAFEDLLNEKLNDDGNLYIAVSNMLNELQPSLEIIQRIENAEGIIGLDANRLTNGSAKVTQEMENAKDVVGARINRIG
jgi:hypothetical protein